MWGRLGMNIPAASSAPASTSRGGWGCSGSACGMSTGPAAMEEKGRAGACRREKLGALVDWADGGHQSFFNRSGQGHDSYARGGGERPSGAAHIER